ncbi:MAG: PAS domain-containing protein [Phycisphaerales bacterium]|nr:PAS domain-containing protein [Phycisphaerales bacterium]
MSSPSLPTDRVAGAAERVDDWLDCVSIDRIMSQLPATIWTVDTDLRVRASVGEGLRRLGLPNHHTVGRTLFEHFDTTDPAHPVIAAHRRALAGESVRYPGRTASSPAHVLVEPIRDADGLIVGCVAVSVCTPEAPTSNATMPADDALMRRFADNIDAVIWLSDSTLRNLLYLNPAYETIWGRPAAELIADPTRFLESVHPEDRESARLGIESHRTGIPAEAIYRIVRPDGSIRWIRDRSFPIRDESGYTYRVGGLAEDITPRRRDRDLLGLQRRILERLAESADLESVPIEICLEAEALLTDASCLIVRLDGSRVEHVASPRVSAEIVASMQGARLHADGLAAIARGFADLSDGRCWHDGRPPWTDGFLRACWGLPVRTRSRSVVGLLLALRRVPGEPSGDERIVLDSATHLAGIALERLAAEQRQRLMVQELDHRVKNNLASVLALAQQTAESERTMADFLPALSGRIRSLAIAHEQLAESRWEGTDLASVATQIAGAVAGSPDERIRRTGEHLVLPPDLTTPLALVLHELATNAVRHGALSVPAGAVDLAWRREGREPDTRLHLEWTERGGPAVEREPVRGLGMRLIVGLIESQLRGGVEFAPDRAGMICRIDVPLRRD